MAAITGTAALLRASGVAFDALRVVGVGYLLLMALMTWRDTGRLFVIYGVAAAAVRHRVIDRPHIV